MVSGQTHNLGWRGPSAFGAKRTSTSRQHPLNSSKMTQSGISVRAYTCVARCVGSWRVKLCAAILLAGDRRIPEFQLTAETLSFALSLGP
jgi:hypothetical protein